MGGGGWCDGVVPVAVEVVGGEGDPGELFVGDLDAGGVVALVEAGVDLEAGAGGGVGDQIDDDLVAGEWATRGSAAYVHLKGRAVLS